MFGLRKARLPALAKSSTSISPARPAGSDLLAEAR
jgi:hypothetical protein